VEIRQVVRPDGTGKLIETTQLTAYANQPKQNSENAFIKAKICLRRSRVIFASIAFEEFRLICISRRFFFGYFLFIAEKKVTLPLLTDISGDSTLTISCKYQVSFTHDT